MDVVPFPIAYSASAGVAMHLLGKVFSADCEGRIVPSLGHSRDPAKQFRCEHCRGVVIYSLMFQRYVTFMPFVIQEEEW